MIYVKHKGLKEFCQKAFQEFGFTAEDAAKITDVLLLADLYGIDSHGSQRLEMYRNDLAIGVVKISVQPEIVFETPVSAVIDGHHGMGQLVGIFAMEQAIAKAEKSGIGLVSVRNSNHYGIAGYYTKMACDRGFLGISTTNSSKIIVPTFGKEPMLGTNPIAFSMPADPTPFHFDAATSVVSFGKIEIYQKKDQLTPGGWALNQEGKEEREPKRVIQDVMGAKTGGLYPLGGAQESHGGHKGYGFAMIAEILSSILSLGAPSNEISVGDSSGGISHFFAAIDPGLFGNKEEIKEHLSNYLKALRASSKARENDRIYTHGEKEEEFMRKRMIEGIPVLEKTLEEMDFLADSLKIERCKRA